MTRRLHWSGAVLACFVAVGCGGSKSEEADTGANEVKETGTIDPAKNPFAALGQVADAAKEMNTKMEEAAKRPPVEPVKFDVLLPFLPEPLAGWNADEPEGSTTSMGEFKQTVVSRNYNRAEGEGSVRIEITDGAFNAMAYMPFHMMSKMSTESTDGFQKGVTIDGHPGFESWNKNSKSSELWVLLADRFLVHFNGNGMESGGIREWLGGVKLADLAAIGK